MEKEFVSWSQAVALKELGFGEPCFGYYDCERDFKIVPNKHNYLSCEFARPLRQQVFRWFRDKHKIQSLIQEYDVNTFMFTIDDGINRDVSVVGFTSYEEAESACIDGLIELAGRGVSSGEAHGDGVGLRPDTGK